MKKTIKYAAGFMLLATGLTGCTDLGETLYDQVASQNYYNTKDDVVRAVLRPFEHAFWSVQSRQVLNEETADQLITPTREDWWDDGGRWARLHRHQWLTTNGEAQSEYNGCFQGIMQTNLVIEDLDKLSAAKFGFSDAEFNNLKAQNRVLRAWFYLRLLDMFRHIPLAVSYYDTDKNSKGQVEPKVIYDFIESELKAAIPVLIKKSASGGNQTIQGQWTQAGAAALLVRLYLNAKVYIGEDHCTDCAQYAQGILDGNYGTYKVADRWDAAFDWNNETCDELIFAFPGLRRLLTLALYGRHVLVVGAFKGQGLAARPEEQAGRPQHQILRFAQLQSQGGEVQLRAGHADRALQDVSVGRPLEEIHQLGQQQA